MQQVFFFLWICENSFFTNPQKEKDQVTEGSAGF